MNTEGERRSTILLRHRVRAAAHRIVADCELLLTDTAKPGGRLWCDAVGEALLAGHQLRTVVVGGGAPSIITIDHQRVRLTGAPKQNAIRLAVNHLDGGRMSGDYLRNERTLTPAVAQRLLARAAELDAGPTGALSVLQLSEIAAEAGISSVAMADALREHSSAKQRVPVWVRACILGVPDRVTALRFYWIFVIGLCISPLAMRLNVPPIAGAVLALGFAAFCAGALWSTSRAVGWLDRHGWQHLP